MELFVKVTGQTFCITVKTIPFLLDLSTPFADCATGDVRLVTGNILSTNGSGRIEVCFNSAWGTVCDSSFDDSDAAVACSQMIGFQRSGVLVVFTLYT